MTQHLIGPSPLAPLRTERGDSGDSSRGGKGHYLSWTLRAGLGEGRSVARVSMAFMFCFPLNCHLSPSLENPDPAMKLLKLRLFIFYFLFLDVLEKCIVPEGKRAPCG